MTEKNLDDQIRDALGNFEAKYDEGSWDVLSQRMATDPELASETEAEADFDRTIKTKINNINPGYESGHWKVMAERIQLEFSLRRRLIRYKATEIGLVLLAVFTFINLFPDEVSFKNQVQNFKERIIPQKRSFADKEVNKEVSKNIHRVFSGTEITSTVSGEIDNESLTAISDELLEDPGFGVFANSNYTNKSLSELPVLPNKNIKNVLPLNIGEGLDMKKDEKEDIIPFDAVRAIENLEIAEIDYNPEPFIAGKSEVEEQIASGTTMRVGMFGGADYNYIQTPYDPIFDLARKNRFTPGYQGGISLTVKMRDIEIETGGIYSNKEYDPGIPTEFLDNLQGPPIAVSFEKIQLNMLEVPLNFRFFFGNEKRWRFYGQTGGSLHMAFAANYDKFPSNLDYALAGPSGEAPKLESKEFSDGLLEGGNFKENSYFTANLGLGVEHRVSTRWSLFMQPSVKAYLLPTYNFGLGPNQDRISSFSVLTGARVSLW